MQPIDVIDTAIKIGLGALVGGVFAYLLERSKNRNERVREIRRLRQERIIDPVVAFIDELLIPLSESYWSHLDKVEMDVSQKVVILRNKEAMVEARIAALGDQELRRKFDKFSAMPFRVRAELSEGKINEARDLTHEATNVAGEILALLFRLRNEGRA